MIWADMEGVAGIASWEQVGGSSPLYEEGRRLYTEEVNAAVRGCRAGGASEITVVDGHGGAYPGARGFMSLIPDRLEPGARYVLGHPWTRHIEPLEQGCDAVLFVGAHAMSGTPDGVLSHTVSTEAWYLATINGTPVGETGIIAAIAGCWKTPGIFVSGDEATCREVQALLGTAVVTAPVKRGLGRYSAAHLSAADARALIEAKAAEALRARSRWPTPLVFAPPVTFQVELATPDRAEAFRGRTGVEIVGPRTVRATGETFWHAWDAFWCRT
ncbi:MAG: M55 family metallopeptidase [Armatimonadota bacterium]|nr:M55 family metallopeptidase [Armatimonadota bacterium]MDR7519109.1 M55 family metallopeptidase [Armatimonadota bacterium]MDR7548962.1 M55 family metallopeptidase [Armatimonadota bacterium]